MKANQNANKRHDQKPTKDSVSPNKSETKKNDKNKSETHKNDKNKTETLKNETQKNAKNMSGTPKNDKAKSESDKDLPNDTPLFFYMPDAKYGELCQWFPATFTVDKAAIEAVVERPTVAHPTPENEPAITFSCAEQFMMYCKAARFGDTDTMRRVLATADPKEQKRLGKQVEGLTEDVWGPVKSAVVVAGNVAKFGQNPKLRGKLLATGDRLLVEAASRDRVWGIGYTEKHAMSFREHWGENRLGRALMEARDQLRESNEEA